MNDSENDEANLNMNSKGAWQLLFARPQMNFQPLKMVQEIICNAVCNPLHIQFSTFNGMINREKRSITQKKILIDWIPFNLIDALCLKQMYKN